MTPAVMDALAHFGLTRPIFIDFEYYAPPGCNPMPICVAWICPTTGESGARWLWDEPQPCPFPMTVETVLLSYNIAAEVSCFLTLSDWGWPRPTNVVDLWLEYGQVVNVWPAEAPEWKPKRAPVKKPRKGLLDAMRAYGPSAIAAFHSRTASNFGVQAVAGDIMRVGSIFAMQTRPARVHVLGSAHDAYVIEAPTEEIDAAIAWMTGVMDRAVKTVLGPECAIRVKVDVTHGPNACDWEQSDLFDLIKEIVSGLEEKRKAA